MPITGRAIGRNAEATKTLISYDIADLLGIPRPPVSTGSSVDAPFLDGIYRALRRGINPGTDANRKTERVMQALGLTYDPYWDTSELSDSGGGSTVTTRAYSRIRAAISGVPRCFIIDISDPNPRITRPPSGAPVYTFGREQIGYDSFIDAGPGSLVAPHRNGRFIQTGSVSYVAPRYKPPPWSATIIDWSEFAVEVDASDLNVLGWDRRRTITEIDFPTFCAIVAAGEGVQPARTLAEGIVADVGGDVVAERVLHDPAAQIEVGNLRVPDTLPSGDLVGSDLVEPEYVDDGAGAVVGTNQPPPVGRTPADRRRDKLAELRAVEIAVEALGRDGWTHAADRQQDKVGYDLEFTKGDRLLKVEVKGIHGDRLAFNLTPKEWWRAQTDADWVVVAVTSVLSPKAVTTHFLTRDRVVGSRRVITGYRVTL